MASPYRIRTFGDPILKMNCTEITDFDDSLKQMSADMLETMYEAPGVGLAATQIGVGKQIFVYDAAEGEGPFTVINPKIVMSEGKWSHPEGCLSVPGLYFECERAEHVVVEGFDLEGKAITIEAHEFHAKILQHEIDHLNGMLYLSRLDKETRKSAMRALREKEMKATS